MEYYDKIKLLILKYKEIIAYLIFGGLTTLVNVLSYFVTYNCMHIANVPSTVIAWVLSVIFAYITNKIWVFESKSWRGVDVLRECVSFFGCRAGTGLLDIAIMWVFVDKLGFYGLLIKILSNIIVIVLNFVFSKLIIFKKKI